MSKTLKALLKDGLTQDLAGSNDVILVDSSRLKAQEAWQLRGQLAKSGLRMKVVKNSIASLVLREKGGAGLDKCFEGPVTLVYGGESAGAGSIVRALEAWNKKSNPVSYRGGLLDGAVGAGGEIKSWALLPTREEMLSQVLGILIAPASEIARLMHATRATFPNLLAAHVEKLEKEQAGTGEKGPAADAVPV